jgi:hypothetical protein
MPLTQTNDKRLARESHTLSVMIAMYCRDHHGAGGTLCAECAELDAYAQRRLARCRFGADKPVCSVCPVHCYKADMRSRITEVMRYAGPRMMKRHPVLGVTHLVDRRRGAPFEDGGEEGR